MFQSLIRARGLRHAFVDKHMSMVGVQEGWVWRRQENRWMKRKREKDGGEKLGVGEQTALSWSRPETNLEIQGL